MEGGGTRTSWEMMGWTEADNKNPHARRFIIFFYIFSTFFLTQLSRLGLKPYSVNSVSPSLYLVPQWFSRVGHQPSAITRSLTAICLRSEPPERSVRTRPAKIRPSPPHHHSSPPPPRPCQESPAPSPPCPAHTPPAGRAVRSEPARSHHPLER